MLERCGRRLVTRSSCPAPESRTGLVIRVLGPDGAPPYVIKWQSDGHIAMVTPSQYARIVPAGQKDAAGGIG